MEADEICRKAKELITGATNDSRYWVMERQDLAAKIGCSLEALHAAMRANRNFDLQPINNFEKLGYGYFSDEELEENEAELEGE